MNNLYIQPHNIEAEQSFLWSLLISPEYFSEIEINSSDFYDNINKIIFTALEIIKKEWMKIDLISVKNHLEKQKLLHKVWWISYLTDLYEIVPTTTNIKEYEKIIKEKSKLRRVLQLMNRINSEIYNENKSSEIINNIYSEIQKIEEDTDKKEDMAELYEETLEYIENIKSKELVGISYGKEFNYLDLFTGWIQPWNIIRIWWWSNIWKTWLLYNFLLELVEKDDRITFFSLENAGRFTMKNICWLKKWVNSLPQNIKNKNIDFTDELAYFFNKENFVLDTESRKLSDIFRKTLKNKSKYIFIDYLQLVQVDWAKTKNDRLTEYAFQIQEFAQKNGITIFDLSQLSNESNRGWVDSQASTEFYWASELKSATDVWIHIFENKTKMELKKQSIEAWETTDFNKNYIHIKISKNRLWAGVGTIHNHIIDFSKWWKLF